MIRIRELGVRAVVVLSLASLLVAASPTTRADDAPPKSTGFSETGDTPVVDLLRTLAKATGRVIVWNDDDKVVNQRKVQTSGIVPALSGAKYFDMVAALLAHEEILLLRFGPAEAGMYRAVDARRLQSEFVARAQPDVVAIDEAMLPTLDGQAGRFVSATIKVSNLSDLRDARQALARMLTPNNIGSIQEVPAASAFIVTDFAPVVAAMWRTIRLMDTPREAPATRRTAPAYFKLKFARAPRVAQLLMQLFLPVASTAGPTTPPGQPNVMPVPGTTAPAARIGYDEVTNQVVVIATAEDTATMREIVEHVDVDANR